MNEKQKALDALDRIIRRAANANNGTFYHDAKLARSHIEQSDRAKIREEVLDQVEREVRKMGQDGWLSDHEEVAYRIRSLRDQDTLADEPDEQASKFMEKDDPDFQAKLNEALDEPDDKCRWDYEGNSGIREFHPTVSCGYAPEWVGDPPETCPSCDRVVEAENIDPDEHGPVNLNDVEPDRLKNEDDMTPKEKVVGTDTEGPIPGRRYLVLFDLKGEHVHDRSHWEVGYYWKGEWLKSWEGPAFNPQPDIWMEMPTTATPLRPGLERAVEIMEGQINDTEHSAAWNVVVYRMLDLLHSELESVPEKVTGGEGEHIAVVLARYNFRTPSPELPEGVKMVDVRQLANAIGYLANHSPDHQIMARDVITAIERFTLTDNEGGRG